MNYTEISQSIKKLRKSKNITQAQLAEIAGVSRITINKLENNKFTDISILNLIRILDRLGYQLEFKEHSKLPVFEEILEMHASPDV